MSLNTLYYSSPIGLLIVEASDSGITRIWMEGQKDFPQTTKEQREMAVDASKAPDPDCNIHLQAMKTWLDQYFNKENPPKTVRLDLSGSAFDEKVWNAMAKIPYGQTVTYAGLAAIAMPELETPAHYSRVIGWKMGQNPVPIYLPCHRVIAKDPKKRFMYSAGPEKKDWLLTMEFNRSNPLGIQFDQKKLS